MVNRISKARQRIRSPINSPVITRDDKDLAELQESRTQEHNNLYRTWEMGGLMYT